jgi:hypothetical protein
MPKLYGKSYTKDELMQRVGNIDQVGGAKKYLLTEGNTAGVEAVEFRNGNGLNFTALAGRGLDISAAEYGGQSLCWRSHPGDVAGTYFDQLGFQWLRSFFGGLLCTCGMSWAGAPCKEDDECLEGFNGYLGLHGRVSNTPAKNVCVDGEWQGDDYVYWAQGKVTEAQVFAANLELTRKITGKLGVNKIWVHDRVENKGWVKQDHMFLYHCNLGFPLCEGGGEYLFPALSTTPRTPLASEHIDTWRDFPVPTKDQEEWVYYHDLAADADGMTMAAFVNREFNGGQGFGISFKWDKKVMPYFIQWKMPAQGTYVTGLEPANCHVDTRVLDREEGRLVVLEPGEVREYVLEIDILTNQCEIAATEAAVKALVG